MGKFTKNTLLTIATQLLVFVFNLGISIIIARTLGPEKKGIYSLALLLPLFLLNFTYFGIGPATVYFTSKKKYPLKQILGTNLFSSAILGIAAFSIGLVIAFFFNEKIFPGVNRQYLLLALILIPLNLVFGSTLYIFLGLEKIKKYNFFLAARPLLVLILMAVFLGIFKLGIRAALFIEIAVFSLLVWALLCTARRQARGICSRPNRKYLKVSFFYGLKVHISNLFHFLHLRIDTLLIGIFLNPAMVGFYSLSAGLTDKIWLIADATGSVLFPKTSKETNPQKIRNFTPLVFRSIILLNIIIIFILFLISRQLILTLYSETFANSIKPFQILLIGAVSFSGWQVLENDIKGRGKPLYNAYATGLSLSLNIILNLLWITRYGIIGAAWATSISYTTMLLVTLIIYAKISKNKLSQIILIQKIDWHLYRNLTFNLFQLIKKRAKK